MVWKQYISVESTLQMLNFNFSQGNSVCGKMSLVILGSGQSYSIK